MLDQLEGKSMTYERIRIRIETENDAFADNPASEIARILGGLVIRFQRGDMGSYMSLHDINGNMCGELQIETCEVES